VCACRYNWEKKLESGVKSSLGAMKRSSASPTIISPANYRKRFLDKMRAYFTFSPPTFHSKEETFPGEAQAEAARAQASDSRKWAKEHVERSLKLAGEDGAAECSYYDLEADSHCFGHL